MNELLESIPPSVIRAINDRKKPGAIDLGMGEPILRPDMAPLHKAMAWVDANGCPYSPNAGFPDLRRAIAEHFRYPGLDRADSTLVTIGSQEALYVAIKALLNPGRDEVLVVGPAFPAYAKLCNMEGVAVREVMLDPAADFAPDAERVLAALSPQTRMIVIASPNNPSGRIWSEGELMRLSEGLLRQKNPPYLLTDEVYRDIYFTQAPPPAAARFYPRTLVAGSLSKSCALTGLRLGWLLMPAETQKPIYKVHQLAVSCAETIAQRAALTIFEEPQRLAAHRPHYLSQQQALCQILDKLGLGYIRPEGAFYCMVRLSGAYAKDSMGLSMRLLERENLVVIPGSAFGDAAEGFVRITFTAAPETIEAGLQLLAGALTQGP